MHRFLRDSSSAGVFIFLKGVLLSTLGVIPEVDLAFSAEIMHRVFFYPCDLIQYSRCPRPECVFGRIRRWTLASLNMGGSLTFWLRSSLEELRLPF